MHVRNLSISHILTKFADVFQFILCVQVEKRESNSVTLTDSDMGLLAFPKSIKIADGMCVKFRIGSKLFSCFL
jgi:hypothetical protein